MALSIIDWLPTAITILLWVLIFCARNFILAKIKASVEHEFNAKLELLKSELRSKESKISYLYEAVLTGRNERQAIVNKRKIDAVDNIWKSVIDLERFKPLARAMSKINLEYAESEEALGNPNVRKFFEQINKLAPENETLKPCRASNERPFISAAAWGYFLALQTVLYGSFLRANMLKFGLPNSSKWMDNESEKRVLKAALPHQKDYIDTYDPLTYFYLVEELEEKLLKELNNILDGKSSDDEDIKRAADILNVIAKEEISLTISK
ncbi:MAG: hypothetical protein INF44_06495 [Thalassospira sp.]|jgi:hypothetical protein|nr:hypothetical protein [Thalassospira sp.]